MRVLLVSQGQKTSTGTGVYARSIAAALRPLVDATHLVDVPKAASPQDWARFDQDLRSFQPDLLHILHARPRNLRRFVTRYRHIAKIVTVHNLPPDETAIDGLYQYPALHVRVRDLRYLHTSILIRRLLRAGRFSAIICDSEPVAQRVRRCVVDTLPVYAIPIAAMRRDVAGASINNAAIDSIHGVVKQGRPTALTVAAYVFHKGLHHIVPAVARLKAHGIALHYVVIGKTRHISYLRYLEALVRRFGVEDMVTLLSDVPDEVVAAAHEVADIYVQPSLEEGFCIGFLEASLKIPQLIGTRVGEIPKILSARGQAENCIPANDADALYSALVRAIGNHRPDTAVDVEQLALLSRSYSWENTALLTREVYERAVERGSQHSTCVA